MSCESLWVVMTVASLHLTPAGENQQNLGFGVECGALDAGYYRNSEDRPSAYIGAHWFPLRAGPVAIGARAELVSGYRVAPILPAAALVAAVEFRRFGAEVTFIPDPIAPRRSVFGFQLKFHP